MDGADVVHLAAHGIHQPDNALFSAIELHGGPLMGYDAARLRAAPRLVVLSCCDLGLADVRPGDETLGMATARDLRGATHAGRTGRPARPRHQHLLGAGPLRNGGPRSRGR